MRRGREVGMHFLDDELIVLVLSVLRHGGSVYIYKKPSPTLSNSEADF